MFNILINIKVIVIIESPKKIIEAVLFERILVSFSFSFCFFKYIPYLKNVALKPANISLSNMISTIYPDFLYFYIGADRRTRTLIT